MIYKAQIPTRIFDRSLHGLPVAVRDTIDISVGDVFRVITYRPHSAPRGRQLERFEVQVEVAETGDDYIVVRDTPDNNWEANGAWIAGHSRGIETRLEVESDVTKYTVASHTEEFSHSHDQLAQTRLKFVGRDNRGAELHRLAIAPQREVSTDFSDEVAARDAAQARRDQLRAGIPSIAEQIKAGARQRGWTDDDLSKISGISRAKLRGYLSGDERPNRHGLSLLAAAIGPIQTDIDHWVGQDLLHVQLKKRREALGITQAQLAERIGTTQGRIGDWERATRTPGVEWLQHLAGELGPFLIEGESQQERDVRGRAKEMEWWKTDRIINGVKL